MQNQSIHPWVHIKDGRKRNTAEPRSMRRLQHALAGIERHLEQHPGDSMARARRDTIKKELGA